MTKEKKETYRCLNCKKLYMYQPPEGDPNICPLCGQKNDPDFSGEIDRRTWAYGYEGRCGGCARFFGEDHLPNCDMKICEGCEKRAIKCECKDKSHQDKYDGLQLHDICAKVMGNRRKILDDFAEAYLAENLKGTEIKNLTLNEQQVEAPGVGYKYWFSEEMNVEWKEFTDQGLKGDEWVWVTDFVNVWLSHPDHAMVNTEGRKWAKANIIHPPVPRQPLHRCEATHQYTDGLPVDPISSICQEDDKGFLHLSLYHQPSKTSLITKVKNCPFCGFKPYAE